MVEARNGEQVGRNRPDRTTATRDRARQTDTLHGWNTRARYTAMTGAHSPHVHYMLPQKYMLPRLLVINCLCYKLWEELENQPNENAFCISLVLINYKGGLKVLGTANNCVIILARRLKLFIRLGSQNIFLNIITDSLSQMGPPRSRLKDLN